MSKYKKSDYELKSFSSPPSTSSQNIIGLRTNDTSSDLSYPSKRFDFIKKLSDGSASSIHLGNDKQTNKQVIIKMISKRDSWRDELHILKDLSVSNTGRLIKFIDFFESQRNSYIVTEFYEGFDLFEHIDINVPYPEYLAQRLLLEMAYCIKECHDLGIVHLDIKCENFMVKKENLFEKNGEIIQGNLVLIDFGHAKKVPSNKTVDDLLIGHGYGTTFYLCPEGYEKVFSSKSDIWSLGICFSLLLTGDYPFYGDEKEYMYNAVHRQIKLSKEISKRSNIILSLCLEVEPKKRPSIDQVIQMLSRSNNN